MAAAGSGPTTCPTSSPLLCSGVSNKYCCPYGLGGSTSVCCNSLNLCACSQTGFCPYKNQCCSAAYPVMCSGANGNEYCCKYGANGSTSVCCKDTNSCAFEGLCCPANAPLFCGSTGSRFCCPYGNGGITTVCCNSSRRCSTNGYCIKAKGLEGVMDMILGPTEPRMESEQTSASPIDPSKQSELVGLQANFAPGSDGQGIQGKMLDAGKTL